MSDDVYFKATKAYERFCNLNGYIYQEPSEALSDIDSEFVYLNNIHGELARYDVATGEIMTGELMDE